MPDRLRRNCDRAESWLCSARIRGPDLIQADLRHARAAHIFAMYRVDTSNRDSTAVIRRAPDASQDGTEVRADMSSQGSGVRVAFFGQTRADIRLRILEGRRSRLEERVESVRAGLSRTRERVDSYTLELQRHGLESVERE